MDWLERNGLAGLPVVHSDRPHPGDDSRIAFKRDAILALRRDGWDPIMGIGDRPSDMSAYLEAGLHALMVIHGPSARALERGVSVTLPHEAHESWGANFSADVATADKLVARLRTISARAAPCTHHHTPAIPGQAPAAGPSVACTRAATFFTDSPAASHRLFSALHGARIPGPPPSSYIHRPQGASLPGPLYGTVAVLPPVWTQLREFLSSDESLRRVFPGWDVKAGTKQAVTQAGSGTATHGSQQQPQREDAVPTSEILTARGHLR